MAIRNADTAGREETCQPTFGAPPPADLLPFSTGRQRFSRDRGLIRDMVFAGLSGLRDGEDQGNVGGIDVLASRQTHRPQQTALAQSLTERPTGACTVLVRSLDGGSGLLRTKRHGSSGYWRACLPMSQRWPTPTSLRASPGRSWCTEIDTILLWLLLPFRNQMGATNESGLSLRG